MSASLTLVIVMAVMYAAGIYIMLERSLTRVLIGFLLVGNATNLLIFIMSGRPGSSPIVTGTALDDSMVDPVPQVLKNVRFGGGTPLDLPRVQEAISQGRERLGEAGRLVIRPSGTEPLIRVMAEGDDARLVHDVVDDIIDVLRQAAA